MKHLIILTIDAETFTAEHPEHATLSAEELTRQGAFANKDMAGMLGYESWTVVHDASQRLLNLIHYAADDTVSQERIAQLTDDPTS